MSPQIKRIVDKVANEECTRFVLRVVRHILLFGAGARNIRYKIKGNKLIIKIIDREGNTITDIIWSDSVQKCKKI